MKTKKFKKIWNVFQKMVGDDSNHHYMICKHIFEKQYSKKKAKKILRKIKKLVKIYKKFSSRPTDNPGRPATSPT